MAPDSGIDGQRPHGGIDHSVRRSPSRKSNRANSRASVFSKIPFSTKVGNRIAKGAEPCPRPRLKNRPLSLAQRQQIWALLGHDEPATQRQGVELLAALGDEARAAMVYRGMDGQQFQALGSLILKNPDVPLQWLKAGYEGIAVKPFDGFPVSLNGTAEQRNPEVQRSPAEIQR